MDKQQEQAMNIAHEFIIYQESEQADLKATEDQFDALWQSIYDVCKLVKFGVFDDVTDQEYDEAYTWLKETQHLTKQYQDMEMVL